MRLLPVSVAILAASATLSFCYTAQGQTFETPAIGSEAEDPGVVPFSHSISLAEGSPQAEVITPLAPQQAEIGISASPQNFVVPTLEFPAAHTSALPELYAQTPPPVSPGQPTLQQVPETPPAPGFPPPGTPTPEQETPNRVDFDLTPGPTTPPTDLGVPVGPPPGTTPTPPLFPDGVPAAPPAEEARVLVSEVVVSGVVGDLENEVYQAIQTRPGRIATRSQLQEDINAIFATGFFSRVRVVPEDTPLGVRVTFVVEPNPVLTSVDINVVPEEAQQVLPQQVIDQAFGPQYGEPLNFRRFQDGIRQIYDWYRTNGYILAQVVGAPQDQAGAVRLTDPPEVTADGRVVLEVAEGVVEDVQVRFLTRDGELTDDQGQPVQGRTRDFIVTREIQLAPGQVFNRTQVERDLQRVFGLGLFEDVRLSLSPGEDPRRVVVVVNVAERNTGSLAAGVGISSASGLFGTVSYQEQNLGGNNQKLGAEVQLGERELLFNLSFTDPWIAGDPFRTSYTVNAFNQRSLSLIFDGGPQEVRLPNGDRPRVDRLGGGISFTRPLSPDPFTPAEWTVSLGTQYQRVSVRDTNRQVAPVDQRGNPLSLSSTGADDLWTFQLGAVRDLRNDPLRPTQGSLLRVGAEQSVPLGAGNIFMNRLRGSYSYYMPVQFTRFTEGPQALAFNIQAGTVLGDLPPYEAFALGGSTSVRGYDEGEMGSGRSFMIASAEYRFPIIAVVGGALFVDVGTDLGTGAAVPGNPAGVRGKPGSGFGYGLGLRIQSPLGPIRIDYGINDQGASRLHFGIGERF